MPLLTVTIGTASALNSASGSWRPCAGAGAAIIGEAAIGCGHHRVRAFGDHHHSARCGKRGRTIGLAAPAVQIKRTLQRQLRSHNTRYQDLLEEVRFTIAKRYLRESNGSLTALADMLCYSDLSTFSTAFRPYHGVSPRNWRNHASTGLSSPA